MTIQDRDRLFARCEGLTLDDLPNLLRAIVEALPVENAHNPTTPDPYPTMPDCVRELVDAASTGTGLYQAIAACRSFYGEVQP